ncbi:MAG: two-component system cell cycle response regulator DivK [Myxococcota bacterium]|jgi:two-component system cell cycle response regulator DivK
MAIILLVEDNALIQRLVSRRLVRFGHEVIIEQDGLSAVERAASSQPDLILMDLGLPVIDGLEATRRIRIDPASATIPIVALTAHAMAGHRDEALEAGCNAYQSKPVDFDGLRDQIQTLLAHRVA